ncbi:MAG TPA: GNAT family N-acetyltransferase [Gemmatimonadaceae bacterium]|nr:GNAT family N-acetyltransferase [Gemmatimonadaceae bacterium]
MPNSAVWTSESPATRDRYTADLLALDAPLFQLPYWNEPLRAMGFHPRYLTLSDGARPLAHATVLQMGPPGARLGLVQRGPVVRPDAGMPPDAAARALADWSGRHGFVFLRFTHPHGEVLDALATTPRARRADAFPFYRDPSEQLVVPQVGADDELLASFQPIARRAIRAAEKVGFRIERSADADTFARLWPLFERLSKRKGFNYRPLESYLALLREAAPHRGADVFVVYLRDVPVEAILVVRDRRTAYYISGALDVAALGGAESPAVLLQWTAMRALAREGVEVYDLGTKSGVVYQFKRKFRPTEIVHPLPVTVVGNRALYGAWSFGLSRLNGPWRRRLKGLASRVLSR